MNAKKASDIKVSALQCAAGAVTDHNAELSSHLKRGLAIFTETPPISERLRCETNGAHKYIEDFATALKALPRGCAPVKRTLRNVRESCKELIRSLKETERLFPDSVPEADRRAFLDCIELVASEELGFYNLVTGESGAEPDCPHFAYCRRINNSVNSIKKQFTHLNIAIQHIERDLRIKASSAEPKAAGFMPGDRRMLRQIHRASVFSEMPGDAQIAGDVRRRQVIYGVKLYRPPTKYDKGFSSYRAAEKAILAPQFREADGAYSLAEKNALAKAIVREHRFPKADSGT